MSYANFIIHLNDSFHPVCASYFVSDVWGSFINHYYTGSVWWIQFADFRQWGILIFNLLQSLCSLSKTTVEDAINEVQTRSFISSKALTSS
jgi:hypothetical protein